MFSLFKKDPAAKLEKKINRKMAASIEFQRNGKMKEFAEATEEVERLRDQLDALRAESKDS